MRERERVRYLQQQLRQAETVPAGTLTRQQMERQLYEMGQCSGVVAVDLNDIIDGDLESFLDLLSTLLTGSPMLSDIEYKVVGADAGDVLIEVDGDPTLILADE